MERKIKMSVNGTSTYNSLYVNSIINSFKNSTNSSTDSGLYEDTLYSNNTIDDAKDHPVLYKINMSFFNKINTDLNSAKSTTQTTGSIFDNFPGIFSA